MFSMWVYLAMAAAIAGLAFLVGQVAPGMGVIVAALGSTLWVAWSVRRQRRFRAGACRYR